jgi:hypothetical protein
MQSGAQRQPSLAAPPYCYRRAAGSDVLIAAWKTDR